MAGLGFPPEKGDGAGVESQAERCTNLVSPRLSTKASTPR